MSVDDVRSACALLPTFHPWHAIRDSRLREEVIGRLHVEARGKTQRVLGALRLSEAEEELLFESSLLVKRLDAFFP